MPNPTTGTNQQEYVEHLKFDPVVAGNVGPGLFVGAVPSPEYMVNLLGARSGIGVTTPWSTPIRTGLQKAPYNDSNSGGTVTYGATTVTDSAKAWVVNQWTGRTVISVGTGSGVTFGRIASNTATVLTIGSWSNGTPSSGAFYTIVPALPSGASNVLFRDSWEQGVIRQDGNTEAG
jgi:hypothetical protein